MIASDSTNKLQGVRVLLVEDDHDYRYLIRRLLEENGAIVEAVESVDEALLEVDDFIPELVISDLRLPERTGFDLVNDLRQHHPKIRTVALSAYADKETRALSLAAGFHAFVTKPYASASLLSQVAKQAARFRSDPPKRRGLH